MAGVAEHHAPALLRAGARQLPAWSAAVAGACVYARGVVRQGYATTSGIDALAVAPVRLQGLHGQLCGRMVHAADSCKEGGRDR
jgi:hypothetical protein